MASSASSLQRRTSGWSAGPSRTWGRSNRSTASQAREPTAQMSRPGGHIHAFCEPDRTKSIPQSSISSGRPPTPLTESTTTSAPWSRTSAASSGKGLVTPVEVSLWVRKTPLTSGFSFSASRRRSGVTALPQGTVQRADIQPECPGHLSEPLAEVAADGGQDRISRREQVDDRDLPSGRARRRPGEHVAVRPVGQLRHPQAYRCRAL